MIVQAVEIVSPVVENIYLHSDAEDGTRWPSPLSLILAPALILDVFRKQSQDFLVEVRERRLKDDP